MPSPVTVNRNLVDLEYAVRGPIPIRAAELKKQGRVTIPCNIGNPQALGQQPISFYRQVLSLLEQPSSITRERKLNEMRANHGQVFEGMDASGFHSEYILQYAEDFLSRMETGMGAYTDSKGPIFIREAAARFIDQRDGVTAGSGVAADPDNIFLTDGASEGAKSVLEMLISGPEDGIMIPIPQYPLYSATITRCGGRQVNYYPDEENGWTVNNDILEESYTEARAAGTRVKAIVVINPGNPTGAILDLDSVEVVLAFAARNGLAVISDEVYQENLYGAEFHSFAKVLGTADTTLFSLHSTSKGFYGECGHRGGYLEVRNPPPIEGCEFDFMHVMFKQASVNLCSNTVGQAMIYLMVSPPEEGSEPHARFAEEKEGVLRDLHDKATIIKEAFTEMKGMDCFGRIGAMYLFPRLPELPAGTTDFEYCMSLLEETGLCTVNGSGFGQKPGTSHLRIAFLPPRELLASVLPKWVAFHNNYMGTV